MSQKELDEPILDNDYPVFAGYYYVVDDAIVMSDITGTVSQFRARCQRLLNVKAEIVKRCDIFGRPPTDYVRVLGQPKKVIPPQEEV